MPSAPSRRRSSATCSSTIIDRPACPRLIETNLAGPGEPVACTPRDAVRTVYSSAIDALVIGRFLLMKDYWLLRSEGLSWQRWRIVARDRADRPPLGCAFVVRAIRRRRLPRAGHGGKCSNARSATSASI